jgi:hypothetical protein
MDFHLAQLNIGKILAPMDSPVMSEFADNLDRINALAESSEGFIWRLKDDSNDATSIKAYDDELIIVNLTVWTSIDTLFKFVYQSHHMEIFKKRQLWFEKMKDMHMVLWYVPAGHVPTVEEAVAKLDHLRKHGDTPSAFSFKKDLLLPKQTLIAVKAAR